MFKNFHENSPHEFSFSYISQNFVTLDNICSLIISCALDLTQGVELENFLEEVIFDQQSLYRAKKKACVAA